MVKALVGEERQLMAEALAVSPQVMAVETLTAADDGVTAGGEAGQRTEPLELKVKILLACSRIVADFSTVQAKAMKTIVRRKEKLSVPHGELSETKEELLQTKVALPQTENLTLKAKAKLFKPGLKISDRRTVSKKVVQSGKLCYLSFSETQKIKSTCCDKIEYVQIDYKQSMNLLKAHSHGLELTSVCSSPFRPLVEDLTMYVKKSLYMDCHAWGLSKMLHIPARGSVNVEVLPVQHVYTELQCNLSRGRVVRELDCMHLFARQVKHQVGKYEWKYMWSILISKDQSVIGRTILRL